jgi:hypothetical protein
MTTPTRHIVTATEAREILRDPAREHMAGQTTSLAYTVIALSEQIADAERRGAVKALRSLIRDGLIDRYVLPVQKRADAIENGSADL